MSLEDLEDGEFFSDVLAGKSPFRGVTTLGRTTPEMDDPRLAMNIEDDETDPEDYETGDVGGTKYVLPKDPTTGRTTPETDDPRLATNIQDDQTDPEDYQTGDPGGQDYQTPAARTYRAVSSGVEIPDKTAILVALVIVGIGLYVSRKR